MIITAFITLIALQYLEAPYGRYTNSSWGKQLDPMVSWVLQECPAFLVPVILILFTESAAFRNIPNQLLLVLFLSHYFNRSFVYPYLIRGGKPTPIIPFILAFFFCCYNGYCIGRYITTYANYPKDWLCDYRFHFGIIIFISGMAINIHSDHVLRNLRGPGETGYKIPKGGMFEFVSGANFFGETLEWWGFALASWCLPAVAFAIFTTFNIGPRAIAHHKWYLEKFKGEYPKERKAFIPFII